MTLGEYKNYPSWMKANMNKCKCGSVTAMFYDEGGDYHVECIKCGIVFKVNTSSLEEAKNEWNRTAKEPECGDFAKCKDGQCGIVTGVTDSKWGPKSITFTTKEGKTITYKGDYQLEKI